MRTRNAVRWAAALPAGVVLGVLVLFPIHWVVLTMNWYASGAEDPSLWDLPPEDLERALDALFVPGTIILGSAMTAPKYHFYVAIAVAVLVGVGLSALVVVLTASLEWETSFRWTGLLAALWSISIAGGLYYAYRI